MIFNMLYVYNLAISQLSPVKVYILHRFPKIALILTPHLQGAK